MSSFNHRRPLQRQSSLQSEPLTTPPSNRTTPILRNHSANPKNQSSKPSKPPLIGILRNKQRSEEIQNYYPSKPSANRAASALGHLKVSLKSRPNNAIKVAWGDDATDTGEGTKGFAAQVARKTVGLSKGKVGGGPTRFSMVPEREQKLDLSMVLCSREELAERLRIVWQDKGSSKKNLSVVLKPQIKTEILLEDPGSSEIASPPAPNEGSMKEKELTKANGKANLHLEEDLKENEPSSIVDVTNIFRRTVSRRCLLKYDEQSQSNYEPTRNIGNLPTRRPSTILVLPIVEAKVTDKEIHATESNGPEPQVHSTNSEEREEIPPATEAIQKRELFQKRTNSAFNNTVDISITNVSPMTNRPKLIRASSVPSKYTIKSLEKPTEKPIKATQSIIPKRRRIKSSSNFVRRNNKYGHAHQSLATSKGSNLISSGNNNSRAANEQSYASLNSMNPQSRQVYQHSKDIVTMVSLLSPNNTDNEEEIDPGEKLVTIMGEDGSREKNTMDRDDPKLEKCMKMQHGFTSLRKTVKSVSFQQSSIHSVRSFCASFPGRRGSVGTTGTASGTTNQNVNSKKQSNGLNATTSNSQSGSNGGGNKLQEKRGSFSEGSEDAGKPKRRLVRTVSESNDGSYTREMSAEANLKPVESELRTSKACAPINDNNIVDSQTSDELVQTTVSDKEAYCLNTYRKLTESGINISLETILRGMLTPTEYRLRCKREDARKQMEQASKEEDNMALSSEKLE